MLSAIAARCAIVKQEGLALQAGVVGPMKMGTTLMMRRRAPRHKALRCLRTLWIHHRSCSPACVRACILQPIAACL